MANIPPQHTGLHLSHWTFAVMNFQSADANCRGMQAHCLHNEEVDFEIRHNF